MSNAALKPVTKTAAQVLEENKARHTALAERRHRVEIELQSAAQQLKDAEDEAERDFGTRDLGQLRELFTTREQENESTVRQFVADLDALEAALSDVERQLAS